MEGHQGCLLHQDLMKLFPWFQHRTCICFRQWPSKEWRIILLQFSLLYTCVNLSYELRGNVFIILDWNGNALVIFAVWIIYLADLVISWLATGAKSTAFTPILPPFHGWATVPCVTPCRRFPSNQFPAAP